MAEEIDPTMRPAEGGNRLARSRWAAAGRHTRRQARQKGIMQEIASVVDQGESPFYLTPFGSHANTITDMVTQFAKDDEMTRLEKMCLHAFDTSDAVLDSIKELKGPLSDQMFHAHSDVADFLSARRSARTRLSMEIGMAARSMAEQPDDGQAKEEEEEEEEEEDEKAEGSQRDAMALLEEESSMGELKKATVFKGLVRGAAPPKSKTKTLQPPGQGAPKQPKAARAKQGVLERLGLSEPTAGTVGSKEQPPSVADSELTDVQSAGGGGQFTARSLAKETSAESLDRSSAATPPNRHRKEEEKGAQQRALSPTRDLRTSAGGGLRFVRAGSSVIRPCAVRGGGTRRLPA